MRHSKKDLKSQAARAGLTSVMNNTKWEKLVALMRSVTPVIPEHRAKDLRVPEPAGWDAEWYYHLRPFERLEWVEIRCRNEHIARYKPLRRLSEPEIAEAHEHVKELLLSAHIPFSMEGNRIRVWGYTQSGASPSWASASKQPNPCLERTGARSARLVRAAVGAGRSTTGR